MATIALNTYVCALGHSYKATFVGPDADAMAARFIEERSSTHAFCLWNEEEHTDEEMPLTMAVLYPQCEHGLSLQLCYGPDHYPSAAQEREWEV